MIVSMASSWRRFSDDGLGAIMKKLLITVATMTASAALATSANAAYIFAGQITAGPPYGNQFIHFGPSDASGVGLVGEGKSALYIVDTPTDLGPLIADDFITGHSSTTAYIDGSGDIVQGGFSGTLDENYYGPTPVVVDGVTLSHAPGTAYEGGGASMLSANFYNGVVTVDPTTGDGLFITQLKNISSPFLTSPAIPKNGYFAEEFTVYAAGGAGLVIDPTGFIHSFSTNSAYGLFFGVPEPAAWSLMLLGFGGIGATLRRRRSTPAAA